MYQIPKLIKQILEIDETTPEFECQQNQGVIYYQKYKIVIIELDDNNKPTFKILPRFIQEIQDTCCQPTFEEELNAELKVWLSRQK